MATTSPLITSAENLYDLKGQLSNLGYNSVFDVVSIPRERFVRAHRATLGQKAGRTYDLLVGYAQQVARRFSYTRPKGRTSDLHGPFSMGGPDYPSQFLDAATGWKNKAPSGAPEANDGPVAYLAYLYGLVMEEEQYVYHGAANTLLERRPDIVNLLVDDAAINEVIPQIQLVNEILATSIQSVQKLGDVADVNRMLDAVRYPNVLPYLHANKQIRVAESVLGMHLSDSLLAQNIGLLLRFWIPQASLGGSQMADLKRLQIMASQLGPEQQRIISEIPYSGNYPKFYELNFGDGHLGSDDFASMDCLTSRTGLDVQGVQDMFGATAGGALAFTVVKSPNFILPNFDSAVVTSLYGARFINAGTGSCIYLAKSQNDALRIASLTDDRMDRINRMVRLQEWLELPFEDIDLLVTSTIAAEGTSNPAMLMNDNTLRMLGVFQRYKTLYGVSAKQFAAWLSILAPFSITPDKAFFDQIFNNTAAFDTPLVLDGALFNYSATSGPDATCVQQICAPLGLNRQEFLAIAEQIWTYYSFTGKAPGLLIRDAVVISAFYRFASLARTFGFDHAAFFALVQLMNQDASGAVMKQFVQPVVVTDVARLPMDFPTLLSVFSEVSQWLHKRKLSVFMAAAMVTPVTAANVQGNADHLALIQETCRQLGSTMVDETVFARSGAPLFDDNQAPIDWASLLIGNKPGDVIDAAGLVTDAADQTVTATVYGSATPIIKAVNDVVASLKLSDNDEGQSKSQALASLNAAVLQARQTQTGIAVSLLAKTLEIAQSLSILVLQWAGQTAYKWLAGTWQLRSEVNTPADIPAAYLQTLAETARRALACQQFSLSPVAVQYLLKNFDQFGLRNYSGDVTLSLLYTLGRYQDLLSQVGSADGGTEDDILAYLQHANNGGLSDAGKAAGLVARLLGWTQEAVQESWAVLGGSFAKTTADFDVLMRLQLTQAVSGLTVSQQQQAFVLDRDSGYDAWQAVGQAMVTGANCVSGGPVVDKQLDESQRDALMAAYMMFVGPTLKNVNGAQLTPEDLYEYLLIDPEVADEVTTSRVASAIASLQEYMARIVNRSEPGFQPVEPATVKEWRDNGNQYAVWAAGMEVQNYAENYISPATRLEKSHYFSDLEMTLNQNKLDPDRVQDAALAYLNQFEAVSNLWVVSGYIAQDDFSTATYYFIGRTVTKPYKYYWRVMDLSKNRQDPAGKPVTPNCWSDWLPISLPLAGDTVLEHTVRPVFYNERLYVAWVERDPTPQINAQGLATSVYPYRVSFGYKRFDDSWTAPNSTVLETHQHNDAVGVETLRSALTIDESVSGFSTTDVNLLATTDFSVDPTENEANPYGRLMLSIFVRDFNASGQEGKNAPTIYGYQYCDSAFNRRPLGPQVAGELFAIFQDSGDTNTLQYAIYKQAYVIKSIEEYTTLPVPDGGDLHGSNRNDKSYIEQWWRRINPLVSGDTGPSSRVYMEDSHTLRVDIALNSDFMNDYIFAESDTVTGGTSGYGFGRPDGSMGVTLRYHDNNTYSFQDTALMYNPAKFGAGTVPDGNWWACDYWIAGGTVQWMLFGVQNNMLAFYGSDKYTPQLNISGLTFPDNYNVIDYSISQNRSRVWFGPGASFLADLTNFVQINDTRMFQCRIAFVTTTGIFYPGGGSATFEMTKDSRAASYSHAIPINESYFAPGQLYINVCLSVGDLHYRRTDGSQMGGEAVWNWFKVYLDKVDPVANATSPQIKWNYDATLGFAQYLDFRNPSSLPANTRLNTTFVRTLIDKASLGLDTLLDYALQAEPLEAPLQPGGQPEPMDFNGANGLYFWEVFFHMPFLVAWRYANEQQFDDAQQWLHYIFDPSAVDKPDKEPNYWNVRPLADSISHASYMLEDPLDPDTQAYADPTIYMKAVFMAYVDNLVAQGDLWYRQLTRDGLTQARVSYNLAAELLGPRPDVTLSSQWTPKKLKDLATARNTFLRDFELAIDPSADDVIALPGTPTSYLRLADNGNFIAPLNSLMLSHWDMLDSRLYNLRHGLTVDGKPMSLPLYEPPANPLALLAQRAQSGTLVNSMGGMRSAVPPYRFKAILPRVHSAVATLSRFGDTLLSLIERGENAARDQLQQNQLLDMSNYAIQLQQQAIDALDADHAALSSSQAMADHRHAWYSDLALENITANEQRVMDLRTAAQSQMLAAQAVMIASGALKLIPNIFGLADGGSRYEGATEAVANALVTSGQATDIVADRLATTEHYRRRQEDWQIQADQAADESATIGAQLNALVVRRMAAVSELNRLREQRAWIIEILAFTQQRFTQASLYQWLNGQLASLYYQLYDLVVSECLSAQSCWQYELADFETTFIQTSAWNDSYRGLQVAATLELNLLQMEQAYLARHERRLEITRTVSLVDLFTTQTQYGSFDDQKSKGKFTFDLTERLYDGDYPGHYIRQIKSVWISLPTLLGPYQDIKATLTQTKSSTLLNASADGVQYLMDPTKGIGAAKIVTNLRASQQIALSAGLDDAGLFQLNFDDDRYLPFEGTGAVSGWVLSFPRYEASDSQKAMLAALTDVIVHVRYTALDGGATFTDAVERILDGKGQ